MGVSSVFKLVVLILGLVMGAYAQGEETKPMEIGTQATRSTTTVTNCSKCTFRGCFLPKMGAKKRKKCKQWHCELAPCSAKFCKKCDKQQCFAENKSEAQQLKCSSWGCDVHAGGCFRAPPPTTKALTGQLCSKDEDCASKQCRSGACQASDDCFPLRHKSDTPFDKEKVIIIIVGSGFDSVTRQDWRYQVKRTYDVFEKFNMFSRENNLVSAFYVAPPKLDPSFCSTGCAGVERLLCCNVTAVQNLSQRCFAAGPNVQTLVVHNDESFAGAGYPSLNFVTMTTHLLGPYLGIHELGHSLFELADEYPYASGTSRNANCDHTNRCRKWKDLIKNTPDGYDQVECTKGCRGNQFNTGGPSFMLDVSKPVGAVNERFTCCTFLALTGSMPPYCSVFNFTPKYLRDYCVQNDYQHYYYDPSKKPVAIPSGKNALIDNGDYSDSAKYIDLSEPMLVTIRFSHGTFEVGAPVPGPPGLYRKRRVNGDYPSIAQARQNGAEVVVAVEIIYGRGKEVLYFSRHDTVEVPPLQFADKSAQDTDSPQFVSRQASILELALDPRGDTIENIQVRTVNTSRRRFR